MVAAVVVVGDERRDLGFEIAGQEVIFQQDAVFEGRCQRSILPWVIG